MSKKVSIIISVILFVILAVLLVCEKMNPGAGMIFQTRSRNLSYNGDKKRELHHTIYQSKKRYIKHTFSQIILRC